MPSPQKIRDVATGVAIIFVVLTLIGTTIGWIVFGNRQRSVIDGAPAPQGTPVVALSVPSVLSAPSALSVPSALSAPSVTPAPPLMPTRPVTQFTEKPAMTPTPPPIDCGQVACVALTFDDGPSPMTPGLLAALAAGNVKATFFLVGTMVQRRPDAVAAIAQAGMVIGNHSYSHPSLKNLAPDAIAQQIQQASDAIVAAGGPVPTLLRPPYGDRSAALTQVEQDMGLVEVLWNVDPEDWTNPGADAVVQRVVDAAKPGSIILMHDLYQGTVDALPRIIDALQAKGMVLVTVPELIGQQAPGTNVFNGPKG